jgi:hypothetical protein
MKIVGIIIGGLIALFALPFLAIGIGIVGWVGDGTGIDIPIKGLDAPPKVVAIVSPAFDLDTTDLPSQVTDASVTFDVTPAPGGAPLFVGLAASQDVERYLRNVTTAQVEPTPQDGVADGTAQAPAAEDVVSGNGTAVQLVVEPGARTRVAPPATRRFWIRQADTATGALTVSLADLDGRDVRVVVLRDDGRPGLAVDASMRFSVPFLSTVGWWALGIGVAIGLVGIGLIIWMIVLLSRPKRPTAATSTAAAAAAAPPSESTAAAGRTEAVEPLPAVDTTPLPKPPGDDASSG